MTHTTIQTSTQNLKSTLGEDLLAGLTGAVAGAPQAMAFAIIAGVSPIYGLYTAIVATIVGAITGSSVYMTVGPTNALSLVVGATLIRFPESTEIERLATLTLLVGIFQFAFGVLRLGDITRFVSEAVMTGFITGAGLLIVLGQLSELTGYHAEGSTILARTWDWLLHLPQSDLQASLIGIVATAMIYFMHHSRLKSVATLVTILATSLFIYAFGWETVPVVQDMSPISSSLPAPALPNLGYVDELWSVGLAMAVLALVQGAGISQGIPQPDGSQPNVSRDFVGQGASNLAGSFFLCMPAGGSLSRTAVNVSAGARTRLANIFAGIFVLLIVLTLGQLIEQIALAALAGHLIIAAFSLLSWQRVRLVWDVGMSPRIAMVATFVAALTMPLEYSIYIGVALSLVMYVYTSASNLRIKQLVPTPTHSFKELDVPPRLYDNAPMILTVYGNLYFAAVNRLEKALPSPKDTEMPVVILRLKGNQYMGSTGLRLLERYAEQLEQQGGLLILSGIGKSIERQLRDTGKWDRFGDENLFTEQEELLASTKAGLARAHEWLAEQDEHFEDVVI